MRTLSSPARLRLLALGIVMAGTGCMKPQRPVHFVSAHPPDTVADAVARTLASNGHQPATIDRRAGIIYTKWEDTGFGYGFVEGQNANIVRRYVVTVAPGPSGVDVQLRTDQKRCQVGGYTIGDLEVRGPCQVADGLVEKHQRELEELGQAVQAGLAQDAAAK